jgi:hypothetical protein
VTHRHHVLDVLVRLGHLLLERIAALESACRPALLAMPASFEGEAST